VRIATDNLQTALNDDPEFLLCARSWDARLRYRMGDHSFILVIRDGRVAAISDPATFFDESDIEIAADDAVWAGILAEIPPPRMQDLFPAQLHHGLRMLGDLESLFAYYAAVRRLTEVMRAVHNDAPVALQS
jgi:hypothetical protein